MVGVAQLQACSDGRRLQHLQLRLRRGQRTPLGTIGPCREGGGEVSNLYQAFQLFQLFQLNQDGQKPFLKII